MVQTHITGQRSQQLMWFIQSVCIQCLHDIYNNKNSNKFLKRILQQTVSMRFTLVPGHCAFSLSQLPGVYTAPQAAVALKRLFLPLGDEKQSLYSILLNKHKCQDRDSNPHSGDFTTRT